MKVDIDGLEVLFPYPRMYEEQFRYMRELKRALDGGGHCMLEMPTGTGKTVALLSLVLSYKKANPKAGKLLYCTRTVPEMSKCVAELKKLMEYRKMHAAQNLGIHSAAGDSAAHQSCRSFSEDITAVCLSSRRNMCIHPRVMAQADGEAVDAQCRRMTASWVRNRANSSDGAPDVELCSYFEEYDRVGTKGVLPAGVFSLDDLKDHGRKLGWCPYFLTRHVLIYADVVVYNYQYMLDPKVSNLVSQSMERNSIVVFDEAHNIDNVCIEALSVDLNRRLLDKASRNLTTISTRVNRVKQADKKRLDEEYQRLVQGIRASNVVLGPNDNTENSQPNNQSERGEYALGSPVLPDEVLEEAIPGSIRRAEHFISFMRRLIEYLRTRIRVSNVESETPQSFLHHLNQAISLETKPMRFCYSRLNSLFRTLEVTNMEEFQSLSYVADFATLIASYSEGFMVIIEPYNPNLPAPSAGSAALYVDPVIQLACLDASLAIRPVFERFSTVIITSGTLSPLDLYPKLLNFRPIVRESLPMSVYRDCICPLVVTRGSDQMSISTKFDLRDDVSVVRNYGSLLLEMSKTVPDGLICFFPSYMYMESIISQWDKLGVLKRVLEYKLIFIETKDIVETTLALDNYKRACDVGRGAVFFSVARGKVAEGIDFDRHYGRCVILFGIPFQYTLSHVLRARLEYLRYTHQIREGEFLTFDALRQAAQCAGRIIRSKTDYGLIVFADSRYNRHDKRSKMPPWIQQFLLESHLNLSVDMSVHMAKQYLMNMAQPISEGSCTADSILYDEESIKKLAEKSVSVVESDLNGSTTGHKRALSEI